MHIVKQNILFTKGLAKDINTDKDDEKKDFPQENIEAMLKKIGLHEAVPKLKENDISEPEIFFDLKEEKLMEVLDIKTEGKKLKLKHAIKEIKEKHEKDKEKKE